MRRPYEAPGIMGQPCPHCGTRNTMTEAWTEPGPWECRNCHKPMKYWHQNKPRKWAWRREED